MVKFQDMKIINRGMDRDSIEIVPAILRSTLEKIEHDWEKVYKVAEHVQLDITDGVFAGDGTFRDIKFFKRLKESEKCELHMMVHYPDYYIDGIIDLNPARCVFHVEAFEGLNSLDFVYKKLRESTQSELGLAINPESPNNRLEDAVELIDYAMFLGYNPGWANQPLNPAVYTKVARFRSSFPDIKIAIDGHVDKRTAGRFVKAGANILCANTSIFGQGNPVENYQQLKLIAQAVAEEG